MKLFGIEQVNEPVQKLVYEDTNETWCIWLSCGSKKVGETDFLTPYTKKLQDTKLAVNWLILGILNDNREQLLKEYLDTNIDDLPQEKLDIYRGEKLTVEQTRELTINLESYVQRLIFSNISHPVIIKYKTELTDSIFNSDDSSYERALITCAFKYRFVNNPEQIVIDSNDDQKGYISIKDMTCGKNVIGNSNISASELPEGLATEIINFISAIYKGEKYLTALEMKKEIEEKEEKEETEENTDSDLFDEVDEKKLLEKPLPNLSSQTPL